MGPSLIKLSKLSNGGLSINIRSPQRLCNRVSALALSESVKKLTVWPSVVCFVLLASVVGSCQSTSQDSHVSEFVPLVYFQQAPIAGWQGVDWSGHIRPSIGSDSVGNPYQSPDGSRLAWAPNGTWAIVDNKAHLLTAPDLSGSLEFAWADDSSGLCVVLGASSTAPTDLSFVAVGGSTRRVAHLADVFAANVIACSPESQRLVLDSAVTVTDRTSGRREVLIRDLVVVDLQSGAVLSQRAFPVDPGSPMAVTSIAAAHDGSLAAIGRQSGVSIVDLRSGAAVDQIAGIKPLAFSWDGKQLAASDSTGRGEVLDSTSGRLLWRDGPKRSSQSAIAEPGAGGLMFVAATATLYDLTIVSTDDHARTVAIDVQPAQATPCSDCSAF